MNARNRISTSTRVLVMAASLSVMLLVGCQSNAPVAYVPQVVVQGYLYANHPIDSIIVSQSQPVNVYYNVDSVGISGAQVSIMVDGTTYPLAERAQHHGSYYLPDTTFLVHSGKTYFLKIVANGTTVTAQTTVPDSIKITKPLPDTIQYPMDTVNVLNYPSPTLTWTGVNPVSYAASLTCLDTLWYDSVAQIHNRRVWHLGEGSGGGTQYNDITRWFFLIPVSSVPVPWTGLKWYGRQKVTVYALDQNFNDWLKQAFISGNNFQESLNHINGGIGVFGSAGIDTTTTFVKMP